MGDESVSSLPAAIYFDPADKSLFEECGAIFPKDRKPGTLQPDNFDVENLRPGLQELYAGKNPYPFFVEEFRRGSGTISHERMLELASICRDPETYLGGSKGSPCHWLEEKSGFPGWVCEASAWTVVGGVVAEGIRRGIEHVRQKPGGGGNPPTDPPAGSFPPSGENPDPPGVTESEKAPESPSPPVVDPSTVAVVVGTGLGAVFLRYMAPRVLAALGASAIDGPVPIGDAVGAGILLYSAEKFVLNSEEIRDEYNGI